MDKPAVMSKRVTRTDLWSFLKNHRLVKAFEDVQNDVIDTIPAVIQGAAEDASNVLANEAFLPRPPIPAPQDSAGNTVAAQVFAPRLQSVPSSQSNSVSDAIGGQIFAPRPIPSVAPDQANVILMTQIFGG